MLLFGDFMEHIMNGETFRIGTSSYIIPDELLPNAIYLAGKVRDMELVLFEVDDGPNNLPDRNTLDGLIGLAEHNDLTYTVHLPLDLRLGANGDEQHVSLIKARRVIEATKALNPWAYVLHLDGREVKDDSNPESLSLWTRQAVRALEIVSDWAGGWDRLAVENLEGYPLGFWEEIFHQTPVGRCVDVGHLWRDGHDPIPYLAQAIASTRVIHIHGIAERDHKSLAHVQPEELDRVFGFLNTAGYNGVMTVEVFSEPDFLSSMTAIRSSFSRLGIC
jgi:sugar phosphate isomerase/epimerase